MGETNVVVFMTVILSGVLQLMELRMYSLCSLMTPYVSMGKVALCFCVLICSMEMIIFAYLAMIL